MADSVDSDVNRKALQRVDPFIVQILESATQVALYRFNAKDNEWDKTGVEGTLFVYRRSALPLHGFIIMNRLSKTNQVEPITKDLELQKEDPYLLYRNSKMNIFGIWFYDRNDCLKICNLTSRLLEQEKERNRLLQRTRRASESDTTADGHPPRNADILSLLNKAQDVYAKNMSLKGLVVPKAAEPKLIFGSPSPAAAVSSADLVRPKAVRVGGAPDVTRTSPTAAAAVGKLASQEESLTVEALFASATKGQPAKSGPNLEALAPTIVQAHPAAPVITPSNPVLQRLMSNPEHLVEHIERKQRNEFPAAAESIQPTAESLEKHLKEKLRLGAYGAITTTASSAASAPVKDPVAGQVGPASKSPSLSAMVPPAQMQAILTPAMLESVVPSSSGNVNPAGGLTLQSCQSPLPSDLAATPFAFTTPCKLLPPPPPPLPQVSLMSPMMFIAPSRLRTTSPPTRNEQNGGDDHRTTVEAVGDVLPLTKTRLCHSLIYLLKNDPEFLERLHEAYMKSVTDATPLWKS